ncbi:(2Fe-2S) ferredoxin domain-containing protein [Tuwongella immobilis]|uniref:Cobalt chelatase n=1 Tax=Tuwongella immobilis TaxID=692036 RepID=A0A6C2YSH8_9BACT|nr:(2Fe-2S) ferredoxin domain-containing protein [Tuwongella immobilis]VIP04093.1 Uncharacterized protein OS=Singulisphaera acidiphila (strain ATCC BAA-1392 / DSM 18658 / VKM B-2454 / MOB10) GN=Sinac_1593 PE=4 SV=1 [Tuwongella immobilis]VTS05553.1 Uncharacterized protein OS=Singulisphaera acidiphila (strain ATCC BAA-1392 / DSM 18658 / VKM B-2454 / MOB10) GN=Sinac_1593 PE=4 SV=1 [Tuwongella immobilis]
MTALTTISTKRQAMAQLVFCQGCCCGRVDRGRPELPVERLKSIWREEKLNRVVQLTISGCLGPCDLTNVTLVMGREGQVWLGKLAGDAVYDALIQWARECAAHGDVLPLPETLLAHQFDRFSPAIAENSHVVA